MIHLFISVIIVCCMLSPTQASENQKISDKFITIPAGCYTMGNTFDDAYHIEMPTHEVCLSSFSISPFTVTRAEFNKFALETDYHSNAEKADGCHVFDGSLWKKDPAANWRNPGFQQEDDHPVVCVSWNDAVAYASWLSKKNGKNYRLPTEAEWEYAARSAGKQERYAGGDQIDEVAWYFSNAGNQTHSIGKKKPNGLGLYDMSGNVWQWTMDWYDRFYYRESPRNNPQGSRGGTKRIFRGGSWFYDQRGARTTYRDFSTPDFSSSYLGFRLASTPSEY